MDRSDDHRFANPFFKSLRRSAGTAGAALATTDGRWLLVSASLTAVVGGCIAWMAIGTLPTSSARLIGAATHSPLSYELFLKLVHSGGGASATAFAPLMRSPAAIEESDAAPSGVETRTVTLDSGDTLVGTLGDVGISSADTAAAIAALAKDYNLRSLKTGQTFDLTYTVADQTINATGNTAVAAPAAKPATTVVMVNHKPVVVPLDADSGSDIDATPATSAPITRLLSLHFSPSTEQDVTVTRTTDGSFAAQSVQKALVTHIHRAGAKIDSSLYLAAMQTGIPADVVVEMIHMFSYKVDFQRDLHPGDSFEVYYDYYYTPDGQPVKEDDISYASMTLGGKQITLYRYQLDPNAEADYFDAKGQSAKGMLMKTPVDGARISSGFGMRLHPILGYTRMHKGIDFAVPIGTPVMAAGSGAIAFMGVASGYGNFVRINHGNGYTTAYGHLSRFAPGLKLGAHVRQGQVIAYSGMSGLATGPHLHYEVGVNGVQVDPAKVKFAQGRILGGAQLRAFLDHRLEVDDAIASLPLETKVTDISSDLRQAKAR